MKKLLFALLACLLSVSLLGNRALAQELKPADVQYLQDNGIELIDSNKLYHSVLAGSNKVKLLVIFTNYCAGTPYMFHYIDTLQKHFGAGTLDYFLCSSAPRNELKGLVGVVKKNNYTGKVFYIDPAHYKGKKTDDRERGFRFRNDICESCRIDEIGVPYYLFFDEQNKVLFSGYLSRKDFISLLKSHYAAKNG